MHKKLPDFSKPVTEKEYNRALTYCINAGMYVLDTFNYSRWELCNFYSIKRSIPECVDIVDDEGNVRTVDLIGDAIEELERRETVNDAEHAAVRAAGLAGNRKGPSFVSAALRRAGFSDGDIEIALKEVEEEETFDDGLISYASSIVRNPSFSRKDEDQRWRFFVSACVRRGYSMDAVQEVLDDEEFGHFFRS